MTRPKKRQKMPYGTGDIVSFLRHSNLQSTIKYLKPRRLTKKELACDVQRLTDAAAELAEELRLVKASIRRLKR